nr:hypothetical protein [Tanacetum cinerariifolium]
MRLVSVKLCLDNEVKKRKKLVEKELIVALKGELYFVNFSINPEEDDFVPRVILGRSFLRIATGIVNFGNEKSSRNKKRAIENLNLFYEDVGPSLGAGVRLTQEEAVKEALAIRISQIEKIKGEALKEKDEPGAFIFSIRLEGKVDENTLADTGSDINTMPYRIFKTLGREDMKKIDRGITMINHTQVKAMGKLSNVLCQVGVTTIIAKFLILVIPIICDAPIMVGRGFLYTMGSILNTSEGIFSTFDGICHQTFRAARFDVLRTAKSDSDDEEEYVIKRNNFGASIYGPKPAPCLDRTNLNDWLSAIQTVTNPFRKISVWKKAVSFLEEVLLPQVHYEFLLLEGCNRDAKSRDLDTTTLRELIDSEGKLIPEDSQPGVPRVGCNRDAKSMYNTRLAQLLPRHIYSSCIVNQDVLNQMDRDGEINDMLRIRVRETESEEEIFTSVAWIRALNINKLIYAELCYKFYSTYEFDEVCADDELQSKKIIKFRPGGRAHNLTLLEFAHRLGLYQALELEEDGFNVYFEGGLCSDDNFNAVSKCSLGYCKMDEEKRSWDLERESNLLWLFISKLARKCRVLTEDVVRRLSAPIYCRDLDTTTFRDLVNSYGKLIPEDSQPGVPRVGIPRPPRASMQDFYDRIGRMEIRQDAIKHMKYRQSYH